MRFYFLQEADKNIIMHLKEKNRLVQNATVRHSYPFCWRFDIGVRFSVVGWLL